MRTIAPDFLLGAGTVLTPAQAEAAQAAGADFALAPGLDAATVRHCAQLGFPIVPGVATATDIQAAWALGCGCQKFFPAEALGGAAGLRMLAAPFAHLPLSFLPLGGIDETRLPAYLAMTAVAAVGGSWIAPTDLIRRQEWAEIERRARAATKFS
jgi:2-dehydro-3-deoxyphosphogluconate aldolase/(4S)-4-hydroxy-2-oxoglutarate aldolase